VIGCGATKPSTDPRYVWVCVTDRLHLVDKCNFQRVPADDGEFDRDMLTNEIEQEIVDELGSE
jgi:hypothetical protein